LQNSSISPVGSVFINEIHYDNAGTDVQEGIEIQVLAGTPTGWKIIPYNGNGGASYTPVVHYRKFLINLMDMEFM
jgi:hypothetical protein